MGRLDPAVSRLVSPVRCPRPARRGGGLALRAPEAATVRPPDVIVMPGRSSWVLTPVTTEGRTWLAKRLPLDTPRVGAGYEVERRLLVKLLRAMERRGLRLQQLV
jgi:hypothetical protein